MAVVTGLWLAATAALLPPFALAALLALRGSAGTRLVAAQLASSIAVPLLVAMSYAFDQPSIADLPLTLVLLTLPGTLLMAVFLERWL
ncbi:monovalent cation/H+ antiporter complex subunit F [Roseomonas populi]|uniref:Monovalent cation/H+ antiporter complex subunit F n=1 Tax=Roseomonas populi TaxID=3121582 RepID=A0ABT1WZG3_9PROT|nr:monovalent cation/H+ antiporter complex subunit F [Roseomonas pecuniae]MCR0981233.1 monovalent cation/H+ antiporter complex subunit F [Roseomonas pecuniae]